jgi:hypothetical protein
VTLPQDVRDSELFSDAEFEPLKKIYANEDGKEEASKVINDFIKTKTYLFKKL